MLTIRTKDCFAPWAFYIVSATIIGAVVGALAGLGAGLIISASGGSMTTIKIVAALLGFVFSLPFSFFLYYLSIKLFLIPKIEDSRKGTFEGVPPPLQ
jgi:hypothetical protein